VDSKNWKDHAINGLRQLIVAVVTSAIIIAGLVFAFSGQSQREEELQRNLVELQEAAANGALATACVLSLPVLEQGRNERDVAFCFTSNGLEPPRLPHRD
jgi:hypothetical protein